MSYAHYLKNGFYMTEMTKHKHKKQTHKNTTTKLIDLYQVGFWQSCFCQELSIYAYNTAQGTQTTLMPEFLSTNLY